MENSVLDTVVSSLAFFFTFSSLEFQSILSYQMSMSYYEHFEFQDFKSGLGSTLIHQSVSQDKAPYV